MDALHSVLKHGAMYSDWEAFPRAAFTQRLTALEQALHACADDAWFVYGDVQRYGELAYATHFLPRLRSSCALLVPGHDPIVLTCVGSRDIPGLKSLTWSDDLRPYSRLPETLAELFAETGLTAARIGLVGVHATMAIAEWNAIREALPQVQWAFRDAAFDRARRRDGLTAGGVRRAAAVVDEGLRVAAAQRRERPTLRALAAEVERVVRRQAAEDVRILVASPGAADGHLRPPDDEQIDPDRALPFVLACEVQRCWAEAAATFGGTADTSVLGAHAQRVLTAMVDALAPATTVARVWDAAMDALGEPHLQAEAAAYGLGHGIGLDDREEPQLRPASTATFDRSEAVALHAVLRRDRECAVAGLTLTRDGTSFAS